MTRVASASAVHLAGLLANIALAGLKLAVGLIAGSDALIADGVNSSGDIFATAIGWIGWRYARRPPDADHHYGHGNAESVAGLIIGGALLATGAFIVVHGAAALAAGRTEPPGAAALWVAAITMVVKEVLYRVASATGRRVNSPSLLASARDHRADVLVALTVFAGILAARLGMPALDPLAAVVVGVWIAWLAVEPILSNVDTLMDRAPRGLREAVRTAALADPDVRGVDVVRVHPLGSYHMVDLEIRLDETLSLRAAHDIAHRVADGVRAAVAHVQDVKVHVNPG